MFLNNEQSSYSPRHTRTHISGAHKRTLGFTTQRILPAYMCIRSPDTDRKLASRGQPAGLEEAISHQSSDSTPYRSTSVCCVPVCVCTSVRRVVLCYAPNSNPHCVRNSLSCQLLYSERQNLVTRCWRHNCPTNAGRTSEIFSKNARLHSVTSYM